MIKNTLRVHFSMPENPQDVFTLGYSINNTEIGIKWAQCIKHINESKISIIKPSRLVNFNVNEGELKNLINKMNSCIETINSYKKIIFHKAESPLSQKLLNDLHSYFEVYRGEHLNPHEFYLNAPKDVQEALCNINEHIHDAEKIKSIKTLNNKNPNRQYLKVMFESPRPRTPLSDCDYDNFTTRWEFGSIYLNYCENGKDPFDVALDEDEVIDAKNIKPLRFYSADSHLYFGDTRSKESEKMFLEEYYTKFDKSRLPSLGYSKFDKKIL